MSEIYDLAILGAGPAGISAAIYAARAQLNTLWVEKKFAQGGQIVDTYEVDNYPGMPGINGLDLGEAMASHAEKLGLTPVRENVISIELEEGIKIIRTRKNEFLQWEPLTELWIFRGNRSLGEWEYPTAPPATELSSGIRQLL